MSISSRLEPVVTLVATPADGSSAILKPPVQEEFILPDETYKMASYFEDLERDTLELTIPAIADWFEARGEAFRSPAEEWKEKALAQLKEIRQSKAEDEFNENYALLELIVVAERLRNWEFLVSVPSSSRAPLYVLTNSLVHSEQPDLKRMFIGEIKEIENKVQPNSLLPVGAAPNCSLTRQLMCTDP